ncbi:hypothetical protein E1218_03540 [Kribbella turkmenica]|uniref:Uncharacterized protein n=1 Tax=Kribbella turkmenica TaxID=2530375 RepID=A0A4R4XFU3_9ACTN|nr:hypothetical protein [Kribbella turkmenica]TDD29656.1 hypothetical protein E1218_03540 [Kribbella turkmenica]
MNAAHRLARSLVLLGALFGVLALSGANVSSEPPVAIPAQTTSVLQVDPHGVVERLEQVAMLAPGAFAVDASDHRYTLLPGVTFASAGLLLLLCVGLFLRRERFGEAPREAIMTLAPAPRRVVPEPPDLARLCILRT